MKKEISVCNACGKRTDDYHAEIGWIHIGECGLSISGGRKLGCAANTERHVGEINSTNEYDFCCWKHFLKWLFTSSTTDNKSGNKPQKDVIAFAKKVGLPER